MTQLEIGSAVAGATGEDLLEIRRRGFSLADPLDVCFDPEPYDLPPQVVDWDLLEYDRHAHSQSLFHHHSDRLTRYAWRSR